MDLCSGERFRRWRKLLGKTLNDVCAAVPSMSTPQLSRRERGERSFPADELEAAVTRGLGLTMQQFYGPIPHKETAA